VRPPGRSPTILQVDGYRFFFYSNEGTEPAHVHASGDGGHAKLWLEPVRVATARGLSRASIARIEHHVRTHHALLRERYRAFHGR